MYLRPTVERVAEDRRKARIGKEGKQREQRVIQGRRIAKSLERRRCTWHLPRKINIPTNRISLLTTAHCLSSVARYERLLLINFSFSSSLSLLLLVPPPLFLFLLPFLLLVVFPSSTFRDRCRETCSLAISERLTCCNFFNAITRISGISKEVRPDRR